MTSKDFDEVFAQDGEAAKPENPAIALREQRQARESEARNEFLAAFDQDGAVQEHQDEPAQAAVAAAAEAAATVKPEEKNAEGADKHKADDKAKDKDKK
jgi:outer membrane protein assembly factor BamE (lipoprotein component of BamABCDE complex)